MKVEHSNLINKNVLHKKPEVSKLPIYILYFQSYRKKIKVRPYRM